MLPKNRQTQNPSLTHTVMLVLIISMGHPTHTLEGLGQSQAQSLLESDEILKFFLCFFIASGSAVFGPI